jgi:hypothetical protein
VLGHQFRSKHIHHPRHRQTHGNSTGSLALPAASISGPPFLPGTQLASPWCPVDQSPEHLRWSS